MADTKLVKSAGEHWVCSVLSRLGWAAALTRDGLTRTDILGAHAETGRMIEVQVKAASPGPRLSFFVGGKGCDPARTDQEWYVLVGLPPTVWGLARAFVVPRDHMAAATWIRHIEWQTNPDVVAGTRNTPIGSARLDAWVVARYEQRWDLLEQPASQAPIMLPPRFRDWALGDRVGLRVDHPWRDEMPDWDTAEISESWLAWATGTDCGGQTTWRPEGLEVFHQVQPCSSLGRVARSGGVSVP